MKAIAEERPSKLNRSERPTRSPINGSRDILNVRGQEEGFHYCWVNEDNVDRYLDSDYEFVTHEVIVGDKKIEAAAMGSKHSKAVGNGVTAYLLRCPNDIFEDELRSVAEKTNQVESTLNNKTDGQYGDINVSVKRGA
jgi:hypothetical protein